jgi:hypothetical protein
MAQVGDFLTERIDAVRAGRDAHRDDQTQVTTTSGASRLCNKDMLIIANVCDQYSGLNGGYSERVFKLPDPFYFIP